MEKEIKDYRRWYRTTVNNYCDSAIKRGNYGEL